MSSAWHATYLPIVIGFVLVISFLLLLVAFRSIVVPLKAIVMNLLSVFASYGLLVLVFQKGFGASLLGFQQVDQIEAFVLLFLFCDPVRPLDGLPRLPAEPHQGALRPAPATTSRPSRWGCRAPAG